MANDGTRLCIDMTMRTLLLALCLLLPLAPAQAQSRLYSQPELDALLAPIALYPDPLLSQILTAAVYPDQVAQAADWSRRNPGVSGDDAVQMVQDQPWEPGVKPLVAYPGLRDLSNSSLRLISPDSTPYDLHPARDSRGQRIPLPGTAYPELTKLIEIAHHELRTATADPPGGGGRGAAGGAFSGRRERDLGSVLFDPGADRSPPRAGVPLRRLVRQAPAAQREP